MPFPLFRARDQHNQARHGSTLAQGSMPWLSVRPQAHANADITADKEPQTTPTDASITLTVVQSHANIAFAAITALAKAQAKQTKETWVCIGWVLGSNQDMGVRWVGVGQPSRHGCLFSTIEMQLFSCLISARQQCMRFWC